jgi:hypothetical protein
VVVTWEVVQLVLRRLAYYPRDHHTAQRQEYRHDVVLAEEFRQLVKYLQRVMRLVMERTERQQVHCAQRKA